MSYKSLIKKVDSQIFAQLEQVKSSSPYQAFQEFLSSLDDNIKDIVRYIISFSIILIPVIIMLIFWIKNISLKNDLKMQKLLYEEATYVIQDHKSFGKTGKRLITAGAPNSKGSLSSRLSSQLRRSQIDSSKIRVKNFQSDSLSGNIQKNQADIVFNDLTTAQFSKLSSDLSIRLKFKIIGVEVLRNSSEQLIEGKVTILYLSPAG